MALTRMDGSASRAAGEAVREPGQRSGAPPQGGEP